MYVLKVLDIDSTELSFATHEPYVLSKVSIIEICILFLA